MRQGDKNWDIYEGCPKHGSGRSPLPQAETPSQGLPQEMIRNLNIEVSSANVKSRATPRDDEEFEV
jgi:hypothetical protein